MPPKKKEGKSKKNEQKKKDRLIDDKTFGLKNKNKSKKVQAQITAVRRSVESSGDPKERKAAEMRKMQKANSKMRKKAMDDERNALFGEALMAVKTKTTTSTKGLIEAKGRDHDDEKAKSGTSRAMKMMFQMDAQEMEDTLTSDPNYVRTIEDDVEQQRQKKLAELKKNGVKGTPITEESFKAWLERKRVKKQSAAKKLVEAELKKKKGGRGLSILSGRDLFEYKRDLFKNHDDEIINSENSNAMNTVEEVPKDEDILEEVAQKVETDLFLEGDDDELDDLDDLDDDLDEE